MATSPRLALLAALVLAVAMAFTGTGRASAQAITVADGGAESLFPDGIKFSLSAGADRPIEKVRLHYTVLPDGTKASGVPDFEPGTDIETTFTLGGADAPDVYLPPGTRIDYHWQVTDDAGETARTPDASIVYEDVRFDWKAVEGDGVTVHYYSGGEEDAQAMLDVAGESLDETSALLGATVEFPVNVRIYASTDDMRAALRRRSETYESQVITAGVRVASDTVLVLGEVSFTTLRHELAHVVTAVAGEGPYSSLPAWLDEGTAVYAQGDPEGFGGTVERAIDRGNVLSVRTLTSYPGDPSKVDLFYGQSWSLVSFLVDEYGEAKFAQLFAEMKSGKTTDAALEAVYGFDQDGLENEWRASVGLPPREGSSNGDERPDATFPPSNGDNGRASSADDGASTGVLIGLAVVALGVLGALVLAAFVIRRRYR